MPIPIGIDLGTTNSVVSVQRRGTIETIPVDGRYMLPSTISVRPNGEVLIGQPAKARAMFDPGNSITSVKRCIGDDAISWDVGGTTYTPITVSTLIIKKLKSTADAYLKQDTDEAVVTVPAYFNNNQKRDTKLAAEAAGLKVLRLLPEPTSAAIAYACDQGKDQTILVYDLGGGTFDVSVLSIQGNRCEVVAVDGDFQLGGDDFDMAIVEHLLHILEKKSNSDIGFLRTMFGKKTRKSLKSTQELNLARQKLKEAAERAKIELSESVTAQIVIPNILGVDLDETVTLIDYNKMIAPLVDRTVNLVFNVIQSAKLTVDDIDRVILVGGSTRNNLVKDRVTDAIKEPWICERVDEVVAHGAAIVANNLVAPGMDDTPIELIDVTPFELGVRAVKGKDIDHFQMLIPKNTTVPYNTKMEFTTFQNNQKVVNIEVFQGSHKQCSKNTFIGGFNLNGIPPAPAGDPKIVVQFNMDDSDLLTVGATCDHLKVKTTLDVYQVAEQEKKKTLVEADIVFLIDTSGSMSGELQGVKKSCLDFAEKIQQGGINCRLGLVDFDKAYLQEQYRCEVFKPMDPDSFPSAISKLKIGRLGGCGCYIGDAETVPVIDDFISTFSGQCSKIGILISDEVSHSAPAIDTIVSKLQQANICMFVAGVANSCHETLAQNTNGHFWDLQASRGKLDFSQLLDAMVTEITQLATVG